MRHRRLGLGLVRGALLAIGASGALAIPPAVAQDGGTDTDGLNFAFANELGSGIYQLDEHTVQIYRIPLFFPIRETAEGAPGLRVTFPVCLGFFELSPEAAASSDATEHVATASLVPGLAVEFAIKKLWRLEPFVEFGAARDFHDGKRVYIYAAGLKSVVAFRARDLDYRVGNRLVYSGEHTPGVDVDEDFAMLESGLEVRRGLPYGVKGHALDWGAFVMNYLYLEPTEVFLEEAPLEIGVQYEIGFTVGTRMPVPLWRFTVPRVGLGYRFGDGLSAVRLVLGAAF